MNKNSEKITLTNDTSIENINDRYIPIIKDVISFAIKEYKDNILEIRILGSVPRGHAIENCSDIDFLVITKEEYSNEDEKIKNLKIIELSSKYPIVSKVDIDMYSAQSISNHPDLELILITDSRSIYGEMMYPEQTIRITRRDLADLWWLKLSNIKRSYREKLLSTDISSEEIKKYSRFTGKDVMKCFRRRLILEHGIVDRNTKNLCDNLINYYPQFSDVFYSLWNLYSSPTDNIQEILDVIIQAELIETELLRKEYR